MGPAYPTGVERFGDGFDGPDRLDRAPAGEVEAAFGNATRLLPDEPRFAEELAQFRERQRGRSHGRSRGQRYGPAGNGGRRR